MFGYIKKYKEQEYIRDLQKFKLATENASDHIIITDPEGIIIFANKSVERITGFKPEEILGKKAGAKELWGGLMDLDFYKKLWQTIKVEKKVFSGEITNKRKSGDKYVALASISPVLDESSNVLYYVGIERDITKEKNIDKAKTEFVSIASHQLKTPLTVINWCLENILSGDLGEINPKQRKYLEDVLNSNKKMVNLVSTLLDVSKLDLGTFEIKTEILDVNLVAKDVINELKPQILEKKINFEEIYSESVIQFRADKKMLNIIFQNLLSNAIKYTQNGGNVQLEIEKKPLNSKFGEHVLKDDSITIQVADTGIGIPEGQKEKIFSKMFRADNASKTDNDGTGLGLYIIKSIIDQNGGEIWFDSTEGNGTTFYITFPLSGMKDNKTK